MSASQPKGIVYLVGAGPGDPGLITVRGRECLEKADVILYDGLANPRLLQMAPQAEAISVGKHGQIPIWTQDAINAKLLELAEQGRCVVRLKGGDPAVFARTAEELEVLARAQIPFEVVPGITAALAAASYVGIPITHREHASAVAFVTGQQKSGGEPQPIDWQALAKFPGTLVFYMGVTTVEEWTAKLIEAGKAAATPAAIVRRCTWSDQSMIRCSLGEISQRLTQTQRIRPPVIVIVGEVATLGSDFDWFTTRPLHNCGVLVTRAEDQSHDLVRALENQGAEVYLQPVIEVLPASDLHSLDAAIEALAQRAIAGITFSSTNGVAGFFRRLSQLNYDSRILSGVRLAAVGPTTAASLVQYGLRADVMPVPPQPYSAAGLLEALEESLSGQRWIVTTTNRSTMELPGGLEQRGALVQPALTYETRRVTAPSPEVIEGLAQGRLQFVTVTSCQIAEACYELLGEARSQVRPLSFSPKISRRLSELGWPAARQAERPTVDSLIDALRLELTGHD